MKKAVGFRATALIGTGFAGALFLLSSLAQ